MDVDFCIETFHRVLINTRCEIFNTDQGSKFISKKYIRYYNHDRLHTTLEDVTAWLMKNKFKSAKL